MGLPRAGPGQEKALSALVPKGGVGGRAVLLGEQLGIKVTGESPSLGAQRSRAGLGQRPREGWCPAFAPWRCGDGVSKPFWAHCSFHSKKLQPLGGVHLQCP